MRHRYDHPLPEVDSIITFLSKIASAKDSITFLEDRCYMVDKYGTYYEVGYKNIPLRGRYYFSDLKRVNESMLGKTTITINDEMMTISCKESGEFKIQRLAEEHISMKFFNRAELDNHFLACVKTIADLATDKTDSVVFVDGEVRLNCPHISVRARTCLSSYGEHPPFELQAVALAHALAKVPAIGVTLAQVQSEQHTGHSIGFVMSIYPFTLRIAFHANFTDVKLSTVLDKIRSHPNEIDPSFWKAISMASKVTPKKDKKKLVMIGGGLIKNELGSFFQYVKEPMFNDLLTFDALVLNQLEDIGKYGYFDSKVLWLENLETRIQAAVAPVIVGTV